MSNYDDDQSEDGELARSPVPQEEMDFSLSEEDDLDTGDSLDIKPPQAKIRIARPPKDDRKIRHTAKSEKHKDHSRRDKKHIYRERDKLENRIKRDIDVSKNSERDLFNNAKDTHRGREYTREKEGHREREHFREREAYRESELYRERDLHRQKESHRDKEQYKERDQYKEAYREKEAAPVRDRDRESRYAEAERPKASYDRKVSARDDARSRHPALTQEPPNSNRGRDGSVRYSEKENHDKLSGDKELEDLRSRLLSKRRSNEMRKEPTRASRLPQLDRTQQQRRDKLLETEREMSRRKEASQAALAARRSRRDGRGDGDTEEDGEDVEGGPRGKRTSSGQVSPAPPPRKRLRPPAPIAHRPVEDIVTVSDASDQEQHSDRSNPEEGEHSGSSSESSESSEEESETVDDEEEDEEEEEEDEELKVEKVDRTRERERDREREREREKERDREKERERERGRDRRREEIEEQTRTKDEEEREKEKDAETNSPHGQTLQPSPSLSPTSRSVSPVRSRSRTRSRSRSPSRSRSHSFSPPPGANGSREDREREERERKESSTPVVTSPSPDLPPYFPALQGCRSVEEFQCLNRIEEGTYGVVYRARDKTTDEIVALKRLKMEKEKEGFPITSLREINTLLKGQHPNIVTVREIVVGSNMDKIFIVMDYVEHDLKGLMETMRARKQVFLPGEVKCLMHQLLQAVHHLHDNWILHRDLKTSNLLLSHKGILKVGDFGLAREYGSPLKSYTPVVVTLWYRAPELLLGTKTYSTPIDVWSVGCIFAEFITMQALFPGKSEVDQLNKIFKDLGTPNETVWPGWSELSGSRATWAEQAGGGLRARVGPTLAQSALNLLTSLLTYDPVKRITAHTALAHPFFKEQPLAIDPAMFPTWPAKSEGGRRHQHSPKPPSGGDQYKLLGDDISEQVALGFHMGAAAGARPSFHSSVPGFSLKF